MNSAKSKPFMRGFSLVMCIIGGFLVLVSVNQIFHDLTYAHFDFYYINMFNFWSMIAMFATGLSMIILAIIWSKHKSNLTDLDSDGIVNDGLPATKLQRDQVNLILQNKGVFYKSNMKLSQGEARKIIRESLEGGEK